MVATEVTPPQTTIRLPESTPYNWLLNSSTPLARIETNTSLYPGATQGAASTWLLKKIVLKVFTGQQIKLSQFPQSLECCCLCTV